MSLGSLIVSLGLDAAQFVAGLNKAEYQARKLAESIGDGIGKAAGLAAAGLSSMGVSAASAVAGFNALVDGASQFADLSDKTGASAEALASFAVAAGTSGVSMDTIAGAANKLTQNLVGVDDESKAAGAALAALGIPLKDFKALKPEEQIEKLSTTLAGFEDGANKTAVAMAFFGKSGADVIPFLKTLEEQGGRTVILTQEMIEQADAYADRQAKAKAELQLYAQAIATQTIPSLTAFTGALTDTAKEMLGLGKDAVDLKNNQAIKDFADGAVRALGFVIDAGDGVVRTFQVIGTGIGAAAAATVALASGEFGQAKSILSEGLKDVESILDRETFGAKLARRLAEGRQTASSATDEAPKKDLKFNGVTTPNGDNPAKNAMDNARKAFEAAAKEEEDILKARNRMLDLYNGENLISTADYFEGKRVAQEEAVAAQARLYDQEIATIKAYQAKVDKATEREAAQGKINEVIARKAKLYRDAGQAALEMGFAEDKALDGLVTQIEAVNADVLELTGNLAAASNIRLDQQYKDLTARLTANGDTDALQQLEALKKIKVAQAGIGQQAEEVGRITASLRIQEERIGLARELGATSELEALVQLRSARTSAVSRMEAMVKTWEALAKASGSPAFVQNAERARFELDKLKATADPLADRFNTLFSEGLGNAFGDFITGTKTAADAFKDFGKTVTNEIARMLAQSAAKSLLSGFTGAASGSSGGSIGGLLSNLFSGIFGKATGGNIPPNSLQRVNENGLEMLDYKGKSYLMTGDSNAQITPNSKLGGGMGGGIEVNVINNGTPVTAEVQQSQTSDGGMRLDVILNAMKSAVADDIRGRRGDIGRAMEAATAARAR